MTDAAPPRGTLCQLTGSLVKHSLERISESKLTEDFKKKKKKKINQSFPPWPFSNFTLSYYNFQYINIFFFFALTCGG